MLPKTLASLRAAGFPNPRLFVDGETSIERVKRFGLPFTLHAPPARTHANWFLALWELYLRQPTADRYAIFQDDVVCTAHLREYLDGQVYPAHGYWNLYTAKKNERLRPAGRRGWFRSNQRGLGALGLVLDHDAAVSLLEHRGMRERIRNRRRGWQHVDAAVLRALHDVGRAELVHWPSLVQHDPGPSVIGHGRNRTSRSFPGEEADARSLVPAQVEVSPVKTEHTPYPDHVTVSIASIPERVEGLRDVVERVLPQVDRLCVYLNGYPEVPSFLAAPKIVVDRSQDHGDLACSGRFFRADAVDGYHVVLDDDLIYPPDYVHRLVATIEAYHRRCAVGVHGVRLRPPVRSYHRDRSVYHFSEALASDRAVHLLGAGTLAYHVDTMRLCLDDFPDPFLDDIWFGVKAQREQVGLVCLARSAGWLKQNPKIDPRRSIFRMHLASNEVQVAALAQIKGWRLIGRTQMMKG